MNGESLKTRYDVAQTIARQAGKTAIGFFHNRGDIAVRMKGAQDRVSDADLLIERFIRRELAERFPEDDFLGEETGQTQGDSSMGDRLWVVDPIDGTDCFVFGIPTWCVSIAWVEKGKIKIGVIYDPVHDELYAAGLGYGAWLNGERISVSAAEDCGAGIVGIGHSSRVDPALTLDAIDRLLRSGGMFQRTGSGALSLAWVAAGRLLGYFEPHINSWDCLAGILLVSEAGGWTNDFLENDGLRRGNEIIVSAPGIVECMRHVSGVTQKPILETG
ncbi:MAG: inositol monophosphatase [Proteobacteria bacterium]|nr:inositol monophosphatase [Pseudomonadota bacterium]